MKKIQIKKILSKIKFTENIKNDVFYIEVRLIILSQERNYGITIYFESYLSKDLNIVDILTYSNEIKNKIKDFIKSLSEIRKIRIGKHIFDIENIHPIGNSVPLCTSFSINMFNVKLVKENDRYIYSDLFYCGD
jgi:hypothetical protein